VTTTPPTLSAEQRAAALAKAKEARELRAEIKHRLKTGQRNLTSVVAEAETNPIIARMKVRSTLEAMPGIGRVKAAQIMETIGIAPNRRLGGLGANQIAALEQHLPFP